MTRGNHAVARLDGRHPAALDADAERRHTGEELRPRAACGGGVALHNAVRIGQAVAFMPGRADDVIHLDERRQRGSFVARQDTRRHPQAVLHRHIALEGCQVAAIVEQKQVAGAAQIDGLLQLGLETVEHRQAEQREPDVDFGAELVANAAGALARGLAAEELRLFH